MKLVYCTLETAEDLSGLGRFVGKHLKAPAAGQCRLDALEPVFRRKRLNRAPWLTPPFIRVLAGTYCAYLTKTADNPFYRELASAPAQMSCSFCESGPGRRKGRAAAEDAVAFATRQITAACGERLEEDGELRFEVSGSDLWRRLEDFVELLVWKGVSSAELLFMPRVDDLLAARAAIERCLPLLAGRKLAMRVYGMSVENFSAAENLRLNKGITAAQVHEAAAFMLRTNQAWPEQFRLSPGGLSMILFTPWTTLTDLRLNLDHIERCPLIDPAFALSRKLQLFPGRPVTLLAENDGLVINDRDKHFYNAGCMTRAGQDDLPWRFRHPEVGVLWRLSRRLSCDRRRMPEGDAESKAVAAFLERAGQGASKPLAVFRMAVEAAAVHPETDSVCGLLERMEAVRP